MREVEGAVLAANQAFYDAFRERDLEAMDAIWARQTPVIVVHPGWAAIAGREPVMASWTSIMTSPNAPDIYCRDAAVFVYGDSACVVCTEAMEEGALVATNLFILEDGGWRIVHHHAGPGEGLTLPQKAPDELLH